MFNQILQNTITLMAVINPAICAMLLVRLSPDDKGEQRSNANKAMGLVALILVITAIAGSAILNAFEISLDAFQIVGGVILIYIGMSMMNETLVDDDKPKGISTLVMFAASPGTVATTITLSSNAGDDWFPAEVLIGIGVAIVVTWAVLYAMIYLGTKLNNKGQSYISKFMGLLVMGMGVQFLLEGVKSFFFESDEGKKALLEGAQQVWVCLG
ncbi:MarC family protein [soil metagenome]